MPDTGSDGKRSWPSKYKLHMALSGLALIPVIWVLLASTIYNTAWIEGRLKEAIKEKYKADISLGDIDYSILGGTVVAKSVTLTRDSEKNSLRATVERADAELAVLPLLFGEIELTDLKLTRPSVSIEFRRRPAKPGRTPLGRITDMATHIMYKALFENWIDIAERTLKILAGESERVIRVGHMTVVDGTIEVSVSRPGSDTFTFALRDIAYEARDLSIAEPFGLVNDADITSKFGMGGAEGKLETRLAELPHSVEVAGLDIAYISRLVSQGQYLTVSGGSMDLGYRDVEDEGEIRVALKDLELGLNPDADIPRLMSIPIRVFLTALNSADGEFELTLPVDRLETWAGGSLEPLAMQICRALWLKLKNRD